MLYPHPVPKLRNNSKVLIYPGKEFGLKILTLNKFAFIVALMHATYLLLYFMKKRNVMS